jgi:hypothetical protein
MSYFKFVCNWQTERECFYRRLFGNGSKHVQETDVTLDVSEGDTLFLHRYNRHPDRHGYLYGPFTAASDAQRNIVEGAWSCVGRFPWQVRVTVEEPVYSRSLRSFRDKIDDPPAEIDGFAQAFSEVSGMWLEGAVKDGGRIIEPVYWVLTG